MKILLLHNFHGASAPSGENQAVASDTELLRAYGHDVHVMSWQMDDLLESRMNRFRAAVFCAWNPNTYLQVRRTIRNFNPDVIHIHNTFPQASPAAFYAARHLRRAAVVFTAHNYRSICATGLLLRDGKPCRACVDQGCSLPAIRYKCYRGSRLTTAVAAVSVDLHRHLGTFRNTPDAIIVFTEFQRDVLANAGFDPAKLYIRPHHYSNPPGRVAWGARTGALLYVGRLSAEKGVDVLIDALGRMPVAPPCDIVGDGKDRIALQARAASLGLSGKVRFLGLLPHDKVQEAIRSSRLLIIPSVWNEGFPMVFREAMAAGTPVLASRIGSLAEIVQNGINGRVFDPGSPESLSQQLRMILHDEAALEQMATNAYDAFLSKYSEAIGYESLMRIYGSAQDRRRGRALDSAKIAMVQSPKNSERGL